jgi:aspartyl-tRNA(Asn)/glutamyl-tRNA(Gln) amidotransferase subunit A
VPEIWQLEAREIALRVRDRELSAAEVTAAALARTAEVEPKIAAYLEVWGEEAAARAAGLDRRIAAGDDVGPLAGVPVALKDNLSVAGRRLTCASRILEGYVAPYTATAVERLLAAGAVLLGRANMDEFAMGSSCENSAFQKTRNPWDLRAVPGGSSGGPAAAVAAGSAALALGSDTGGSIRQPAALCGVVGIKPTYGRVSRHGLVAFASSTDQVGPLARSVRDAALALSVIAGFDPADATSAEVPVPDLAAALERGVAGRSIGVLPQLESALPAEVSRSFRDGVAHLEAAGARLVELSLPTLDAAIAVYYVLATSEASSNLARFDGVRYGRRAAAASLAELYSGSRSEGFGAEVKRRILLGTFALSAGYHDAYYHRAVGVREQMRRELDGAFRKVDAIVTPTTPSAAFRLGEKADDPLAMYLSDVFTTPASLVGLPAVAVPAGCDGAGLPLSLQVTGRPFEEATVLQVARALEERVGWRVEPAFRGAEEMERP